MLVEELHLGTGVNSQRSCLCPPYQDVLESREPPHHGDDECLEHQKDLSSSRTPGSKPAGHRQGSQVGSGRPISLRTSSLSLAGVSLLAPCSCI